MPWLYAYKSLGHRFKKRRLLTTFAFVWLFYLNKLFQKERQIKPKTLLIIRFDLVGDYVLFRNLLACFRHSKYRNYHITLCGNAVFKDLAESLDCDVVDDFIWVNRSRFLKDKAYHLRVLNDLYQRGFEIAFQPTYSREIYGDLLLNATQAEQRIGVDGDTSNQRQEQKQVTNTFYTRLLSTDPRQVFEFSRNKEVMEKFLQQRIDVRAPQIPLHDETSAPIRKSPYAVVMAGASHARKRWNGFADVIHHLATRYGLNIVFVGHGKEDQRAIEHIIRQCAGIALENVCNKTSLIQLAAVLEKARIVVSNDTAAVHIAAAVNTPVVCVTPGTHAFRFNRYPAEMNKRVEFLFPPAIEELAKKGELPEYGSRYNSLVDVNDITPDRVNDKIDNLLKNDF